MIKSACVFCGSRGKVDQAYRDAATDVGRFLAEENISLVYGGGRLGLMGLVAESTLQHKGNVVGVIPAHLDEREQAFFDATELHIVDSMHTRKMMMYDRADAFIILPGGYGTLDEFFEILTWRQIDLHDKPIFVLNIKGYWSNLRTLVNHVIDEGFADEEHCSLVSFSESMDDLKEKMKPFMS